MDSEEIRLLKKIRSHKETIIKYGTYTITDEPEADEPITDNTATTNVSADEDQDAKIAEIMNKFASNIQDNVNSLFD